MGWKQQILIVFATVLAVMNCVSLYAFQDILKKYYTDQFSLEQGTALRQEKSGSIKDEENGSIVNQSLEKETTLPKEEKVLEGIKDKQNDNIINQALEKETSLRKEEVRNIRGSIINQSLEQETSLPKEEVEGINDEQNDSSIDQNTTMTCYENEADLVETHGKNIGRKLFQMAEMNLCLSFKQLSKFSSVKKKVMKWVQSHPEKKFVYGIPHANNYAVTVNDEYAYLHVFKNGGTTVNQITKNKHTKNEDLENRKLFTTVRDPIDHFLSGWAECGSRSENPDENPAFTLDVGIDERIESWMQCVEAFIEVGADDTCGPCSKHSHPQANFMLNPDKPKWIHPSLEMVGDLKELNGMMEMANFTDFDKSIKGRSASNSDVKVERYPRDQSLLSDKTLQRICEFVKLDYLLFAFEPPAACREQLQLDTAMVEKVAKVSL